MDNNSGEDGLNDVQRALKFANAGVKFTKNATNLRFVLIVGKYFLLIFDCVRHRLTTDYSYSSSFTTRPFFIQSHLSSLPAGPSFIIENNLGNIKFLTVLLSTSCHPSSQLTPLHV